MHRWIRRIRTLDFHTHTHYYQFMRDPFEKWMSRGQINLEIADASNYLYSVEQMLVRSGNPWSYEDLRKALEKKYGGENFAIVGLAHVVKGEKPVVAMNTKQMLLTKGLYDISEYYAIEKKIYINAENSLGESEIAQLKWINAKIPEGRIVISRGLADKLNLKDEDKIKITYEGQDLSDLDLDR